MQFLANFVCYAKRFRSNYLSLQRKLEIITQKQIIKSRIHNAMRPLADITTLEFAQSKKRFERKSCVRSFSTFISARGKGFFISRSS